MTTIKKMPLLIAIVGPTASGKTALSLKLAKECGGEIVSCDSIAVYRELEIGTAKPSREERTCVPHHLVDVVHPGQPFTAGEYARLGRAAIQEINARGHVPIVVGGTGLYLRALLMGLFAGPRRSEELRERLRRRAESKSPGYLHRLLGRMDAAAAAKIHPNDTSKVIRAIEVCLSAREKMSELWKQGRDPLTGFRIVRIGLDPDRKLLYDRINRRARWMFEHGLVEETRALLVKYPALAKPPESGGDPGSPLYSLGYRQALRHIRGELDLDQAIAAAQQAHRNYAKRQLTWFRREPDMHWLRGFGDDPAIQARTRDLLEMK